MLADGLASCPGHPVDRAPPGGKRHYPWLPSLAYRLYSRGLVALRQTFVRRCHGGLGSSQACRGGNSSGPAARVGKKAPRTLWEARGRSLSDRKSQSIITLSKDQGGSSVLLDTWDLNC